MQPRDMVVCLDWKPLPKTFALLAIDKDSFLTAFECMAKGDFEASVEIQAMHIIFKDGCQVFVERAPPVIPSDGFSLKFEILKGKIDPKGQEYADLKVFVEEWFHFQTEFEFFPDRFKRQFG